jgi:hypothetical protein
MVANKVEIISAGTSITQTISDWAISLNLTF